MFVSRGEADLGCSMSKYDYFTYIFDNASSIVIGHCIYTPRKSGFRPWHFNIRLYTYTIKSALQLLYIADFGEFVS